MNRSLVTGFEFSAVKSTYPSGHTGKEKIGVKLDEKILMGDELEALITEECHGKYSITEFKEYLEVTHWASKQISYIGEIFWRPERVEKLPGREPKNSPVFRVQGSSIQERIKHVLEKILAENTSSWQCVAQFWAAKVNGGGCHLTTVDQPFAVGSLSKGSCWFRKQSLQHKYIVGNGAKEEEVGPPGRVFRHGHPESSPDLRLYSVKEFPLRDQAARCGFRRYLALPLFELHKNQCVGVLELVSWDKIGRRGDGILSIQRALKEVEMRSTHNKFQSIYGLNDLDANDITENIKYRCKPLREIREMLELAIKVLPQLHLAQVWVPCKQCNNLNKKLNCMEPQTLINAVDGKVNLHGSCDADILEFLDAGGFHNVQVGKGIAGIAFSSTNKLCFCRNLSDLSIIDYPLAHYAQKASLSFGFAICLQRLNKENDLYVFEFYLHSHIRDDAHTWTFLHVLLKIMEMKLKTLKVASRQQLGDELIVEVCKKNMLPSSGQEPPNVSPLGYEIIQHGQAKKNQHLKEFVVEMPMEGCDESFSIFECKEYFQDTDLSCLHAPVECSWHGWLLFSSKGSSESEVNNNTLLLPNPIQEKIKTLFKAITSRWVWNTYCIIQFLEPKMIHGKYCLSASDQPFGLGSICEGLLSYRKQCMEHHYFVGEGAKEEELGPPGRVFQSGRPESSPDLRLYSIKELPLRDHAAHCGLRRYLALPVFDTNQTQCVGILEVVEYGYYKISGLGYIRSALKEANLTSTHFGICSSMDEIRYRLNANKDAGWNQAMNEIQVMLNLVIKTPHLSLAQVWVPCIQCANKSDGMRCMKRAMVTHDNGWTGIYDNNCRSGRAEFLDVCNSFQVQIEKSVAGLVLESENRSCFCRNLCDFSITEQPMAHFAKRARLDICFAICLQSSYTGDNLYVMEFFLNSGIRTGGYPQSLCSLLLIMKQKLKSFKVASGQQLGEELVVDVIETCKENKLFESTYPGILPIRFNIIQDSQETKHEYLRNEQVHFEHNGTNSGTNIVETEQSETKKTKRDGKKTSSHTNHEDLEPHLGKRLQDVATEPGVDKSTVKRACRNWGIDRWPTNEQNNRNPSLFVTENAVNQLHDGDVETSISSGTNIPPLDLTAHQNKPHNNIESIQQLSKICCETDVMMVKAKFKDDTIKFQLHVSSGMEKLKEEVNKRLNLKIESFKLKYLDEGDEWILLACDDDLHLCVKTLIALGKTCIRVTVHLISP